MSAEPGDQHLTLLQRLDLALASRVAYKRERLDLARPEDWQSEALREDPASDSHWISRVLALRGFEFDGSKVLEILHGRSDPNAQQSQEARLMRGVSAVLRTTRDQAAEGRIPDGWLAVELFRQLTGEIARFKGNALRRDLPWDGIVGVSYPDADKVPALLEGFCEQRGYGETGEDFARAHPVRRAVRLMWHFGRIAPFSDFNTVMSFILMNGYLLAKGYPIVTPQPGDRGLLTQLIAGPPPRRLVQFESRLVEFVGA